MWGFVMMPYKRALAAVACLLCSHALAQRIAPGHVTVYLPDGRNPENDPNLGTGKCILQKDGTYDCIKKGLPAGQKGERVTPAYLAYVRAGATYARKIGVANAYMSCGLAVSRYSDSVGAWNSYMHTSDQMVILGRHLTTDDYSYAEQRWKRIADQAQREVADQRSPNFRKQCSALRDRIARYGDPY